MSYRIETASSGRAVCRATECKKNGVKIEKGELRMGTWVDYEESGSWHWRHWGCVSGFQIEKIRNNLEDPGHPGVYRWDFLDGYEGDEKNSLDKHLELQDKVRRVIEQGFIDPEDFNGDPEMNRLGEKGLHTAESKRKMKQDKIDRTRENEDLQAQVEAPIAETATAVKNGKSSQKANVKAEPAKDDLNNGIKAEASGKKASKEQSGRQKTKRKRASKSIKDEEDDEEEVYDVKPTKKSRTKQVKKEEESDIIKEESDHEPVLSSATKKRGRRGKNVVKEESPDDETKQQEASEVKPKQNVKKLKGKPTVKEEILNQEENISQVSEYHETKPADQPKKRRGKSVKKETSEANSATLAGDAHTSIEPPPSNRSAGTAESYIPGVKDSDLQYDFDRAVDAGEIEDDYEAYIEKRKGSSQPKKKGGRGKRSVDQNPASSRSKRTSTK